MPAKIVVTAQRGGSRVALVGTSGKELLSSQVFSEPRAKGATVRSLKALLGDDVKVEDHTLAAQAAPTKSTSNGAAKAAANGAAKATANGTAKVARRATSRRAASKKVGASAS